MSLSSVKVIILCTVGSFTVSLYIVICYYKNINIVSLMFNSAWRTLEPFLKASVKNPAWTLIRVVCTTTPLWCLNMFDGCQKDIHPNFWELLKRVDIEISHCQRINIWMEFAWEWRSTRGGHHGFLHLSYEATETLENIPVRATLICAVAYLLQALTGGVGRRGGEGEEALFTLSSVQLNQFTIRSKITVITIVLHTCYKWTGSDADTQQITRKRPTNNRILLV